MDREAQLIPGKYGGGETFMKIGQIYASMLTTLARWHLEGNATLLSKSSYIPKFRPCDEAWF